MKIIVTNRDGNKQILEGGELEFVMGPNPNKSFGTEKKYRPKSIVY